MIENVVKNRCSTSHIDGKKFDCNGNENRIGIWHPDHMNISRDHEITNSNGRRFHIEGNIGIMITQMDYCQKIY